VVEGVADALILDAGRCRVLDWKSDDVTDAAWSEREPVYQRQVTAYAEMVQALTSLEVSTELVRVGVG
jgi:ATP-dependent exoDNAse (exonuclease V) beta subunit